MYRLIKNFRNGLTDFTLPRVLSFANFIQEEKYISVKIAQLQPWHFTKSSLQGTQENAWDYSI